jgi:hypothetical protein
MGAKREMQHDAHVFVHAKYGYHARNVEELQRTADQWACGCPGFTKEESDNMAAQLRAEARAAAKNPDYFSALVPAGEFVAHFAFIAVKEKVTTETEAMHDRQSARGKSGKRPWHAIADPILIELCAKARPANLRHELELRWPKDSKFKLPKSRAVDAHIGDLEKKGILPLA